MSMHGSDKAVGWHNYTTIYSALLDSLHDRPLRIFELGLGTNNPEYPFNMGKDGTVGASLRAWKQLFPKASIYGADIDQGSLFEEDRIQTFHCDQLEKAAIAELWSQPELRSGMDLIIDDGLHTFEGNISFMEGSLSQVRKGGHYVIEDIAGTILPRWRGLLDDYYSRHLDHEFAIVELPNRTNDYDNNMLIVRRGQ